MILINNNTTDNVYGSVIVAQPLREFTRFIRSVTSYQVDLKTVIA